MAMITMIKKRDGREVPFNIEKIAQAVLKAERSVGETTMTRLFK